MHVKAAPTRLVLFISAHRRQSPNSVTSARRQGCTGWCERTGTISQMRSWASMVNQTYTQMAERAEAAGDKDVAKTFREIAAEEAKHHQDFKAAVSKSLKKPG